MSEHTPYKHQFDEWGKIVHEDGEVSIVTYQADGCSTICQMNSCLDPVEHADAILNAVHSHAKLIAENKRLREALENVREGLTINQPQLIKARLSMESEIRTINKALNESE